MIDRQARRRKGSNSIPRWGWIVILSFLGLIGGTVLHINGVFQQISLSSTSHQSHLENDTFVEEANLIRNDIVRTRKVFAAHALYFAELSKSLSEGEERIAMAKRAEILLHKRTLREAIDQAIDHIPAIRDKIRKCIPKSPDLKPAHNCLVECILVFDKITPIQNWDQNGTSFIYEQRELLGCFSETDSLLKRFEMLVPSTETSFH